jgi:hypothetical protein
VSVFSRFKNTDPVKNNIIRQAHPNSGPQKWTPNRDFVRLKQPHEKGNFFTRPDRSGTGAATGGSNDTSSK